MTASAEIQAARIIVAGADSADVALLRQVLEQEGYGSVRSMTSPEEVSALHCSSGHDLIVLDLQTPGTGGFQPIEQLEAIAQDASGSLLVITSDPGDRRRALQAGARDFIDKPVDPLDVKTRVHHTLEVRLLYRQLAQAAQSLEAGVLVTGELREHVARYRSLAELASDWYWEQDEHGTFTKVFGPVLEVLGLRPDGSRDDEPITPGHWNEVERADLQAAIAERRPFLDFVFSRRKADGSQQRFQVSGEPMFGPACQLVGYRGIGLEITERK